MLHAQREGSPRAREKGVLDAGQIRLVPEKLQAFYVRLFLLIVHEEMPGGVPERETCEGVN